MMDKIKIVVSDFDGVMTDNHVFVDVQGNETVMVSRADGQGVNILRKLNVPLVIMSTEKNEVVSKRAQKLNVEYMQGIDNKAKALEKWAIEKKIDLSRVAYIGNDINDLEAMRLCGTKIVPADAYQEVKEIADYVTKAKGGHGVIREVAGLIKSSVEG